MASFLSIVGRWFGFGGALGENAGQQTGLPTARLVDGSRISSPDAALQISAVWACIDRRASIVSMLPFFAYKSKDGEKTLARTTRLYELLSDSPNARMTPMEFWRAMMLNYDLRGNAYARLERAAPAEGQSLGEVVAMWPMPSDQVRVVMMDSGLMVYEYRVGDKVFILGEDQVFHLKNIGNGTIGLSKLEFMAPTIDEQAKAQESASKVFGNSGKPTGILMIDSPLTKEQREGLRANYGELSNGNTQRLAVLEANMKYQQLSLTPEAQQLLETRKYGVEEICRWFDVPAVLVNHSGVVQYGNHDIIEGIFYKLSIAPMLENIEQAFRKRVMTSRQRANMVCEFQMDALLRGSASERAEMYAKGAQNGWITRKEIRQLEGWPYIEGTDFLTAQSNLLPLDKLGTTQPASGGSGANIAQ